MKDDRLRSPVKPEYVEAIGRAAYTFASCEWQVAWSCERIQPGSLRVLVDEELTAGKIAKKFIDLCRNMPKSKEREELQAIAQRFSELVPVRNAILHGKPCTAPDGEQRLSADKIIEIGDLEAAADDFVECGSKLNEIYYRFLNSYAPPLAK
ncbi:MAG: hypothetical protein Q7S94_00830 [Gallionella sp.]|nr:hypothetical protein [Gallionella sp.]